MFSVRSYFLVICSLVNKFSFLSILKGQYLVHRSANLLDLYFSAMWLPLGNKIHYRCNQRAQPRKVVLSAGLKERKERKQEQGERYKRKMSAVGSK